ncbi:MAG: hypothetical protein J6B25_05790 [Clostridia bacterium]|nr:hypothetical protein [Clostridia bacterium]
MKTYDEIAKNALVRRDEYIKTKRKKIKITACACCVAFVALAGLGVWKSGFFATRPLQGEETSAPTTVEPTLTPADPDNPIAKGGDDYGWSNAYSEKVYSVPGELIDYIKETLKMDWTTWSEARTAMLRASKYDISDPEYVPFLVEAIREFDIPRSVIEQINSETIAFYIELEQPEEYIKENTFTSEEIDLLYSGDLDEMSRVFPAENAIIHNGKAFAPLWYFNATDEELARYGITRKEVTDRAVSYVCNFSGSQMRYGTFKTYFRGGTIEPTNKPSPKYYSPELYDNITWTDAQAAEYFGKDFSSLSFMPDGLSFNGNNEHKVVYGKNGNIAKDWCYFRYDKSYGASTVTLSVSKTGAPYDYVYATEDEVGASQCITPGVDVSYYMYAHNKDTVLPLCVADFEKDGIYYRLEAEYLEFDKFCEILKSIVDM